MIFTGHHRGWHGGSWSHLPKCVWYTCSILQYSNPKKNRSINQNYTTRFYLSIFLGLLQGSWCTESLCRLRMWPANTLRFGEALSPKPTIFGMVCTTHLGLSENRSDSVPANPWDYHDFPFQNSLGVYDAYPIFRNTHDGDDVPSDRACVG